MAVDLVEPLELKCKLRERPSPIGRRFTLPNDKAVMGYYLMKAVVDGAAPASLANVDNNLFYLALTNNEVYTIKYQLLGTQTGGTVGTTGDSFVQHGEGGAKRLNGAGTAALLGAILVGPPFCDAAASGWTGALTADTANGGLKFTVTGEANKEITWELAIYVEIGLTV